MAFGAGSVKQDVPELRREQTPGEPGSGEDARVQSPRAVMGMVITVCSESAAAVVLLTELLTER